jgi:hypothetical protein
MNKVVLEKLIVAQIAKKPSVLYGTRRFTAVDAYSEPDESSPHPISRPILILSSLYA